MRLGFGCCTTSSCWSGPRFDSCEAYADELAAESGWLAGRVTTCSEGGFAANRLCSDGYEFDDEPEGEAIDAETLEDDTEGEGFWLELADTNTKEQATNKTEMNFCGHSNKDY